MTPSSIDPDWSSASSFPLPPSKDHWLGTDIHGYDMIVLLLRGGSVLMGFSALVGAMAFGLGILLGAIQGYRRGWVDFTIGRLADLSVGIPLLYAAMALTGVTTPTPILIAFILIALKWVPTATLTRALVWREAQKDYVRHARFMGVSSMRILGVYMRPHLMPRLGVTFPYKVMGIMSALGTLDYFGYGIPSDVPLLGMLIHQGMTHLYAPWILVSSIFFLILMMALLLLTTPFHKDSSL